MLSGSRPRRRRPGNRLRSRHRAPPTDSVYNRGMRTDELPDGHGNVSIEAADEATVAAIEELLRLHFRAGPAVRYSEYHAISVPHRAVHHLTLTVDTRVSTQP